MQKSAHAMLKCQQKSERLLCIFTLYIKLTFRQNKSHTQEIEKRVYTKMIIGKLVGVIVTSFYRQGLCWRDGSFAPDPPNLVSGCPWDKYKSIEKKFSFLLYLTNVDMAYCTAHKVPQSKPGSHSDCLGQPQTLILGFYSDPAGESRLPNSRFAPRLLNF